MSSLNARHVTVYRYSQPVEFGEHRMMFRPRESHDLRLLKLSLEIKPNPSRLRWLHDVFDNSLAAADFDSSASELRFESSATLEHFENTQPEYPIEESAKTNPFRYSDEELHGLGRAARFISGYTFLPGMDAGVTSGAGSTHAWMQAYLPGAGWIDFDPANSIVRNRNLIRVAMAWDQRRVLPLWGTYSAEASPFLGMDVTVSVRQDSQ